MDSNIKFVNNSIDSEDNPFFGKQQLDKIEESVLEGGDGPKRRPNRKVAVPAGILKEGEDVPEQMSFEETN